MIRRHDQPEALAFALGLTPSEASIVARLWRARCAWVPTPELNRATADASRKFDHAADLRSDDTVKVHVWSIRQKTQQDFVLGHTQHGWTLGETGVWACKRIIGEAA